MFRLQLTGVCLAMFLGTPATAQNIINGTDPLEVLAIAQKYGNVSLTTDGQGDPMIIGLIDGHEYSILFYGCTENIACSALQFWAWFDTRSYSADDMNQWNQTERFGKAYLDTEGDPNLDMEVNLFGGVTERNLDDTIDWWRLVLGKFAQYVASE